MAIKTYNKLKKKNDSTDKNAENVLANESELKVFYEYVIEFSEHRMSITEQQKKDIKEEIFADYDSKRESEIIENYGRLATNEERKIIFKEAINFAENLLNGKKQPQKKGSQMLNNSSSKTDTNYNENSANFWSV